MFLHFNGPLPPLVANAIMATQEEPSFGVLLAHAKVLGITYHYEHEAKEQFQLEYKGHRWSRDNPGQLRRLLLSLMDRVANNKPMPGITTVV